MGMDMDMDAQGHSQAHTHTGANANSHIRVPLVNKGSWAEGEETNILQRNVSALNRSEGPIARAGGRRQESQTDPCQDYTPRNQPALPTSPSEAKTGVSGFFQCLHTAPSYLCV